MKKEELKRAFDMIQDMEKFEEKARDILNIDNIFKTPPSTNFYKMFDLLIESNYTDEGQDWIFWWCYENNFGNFHLKAADENGDPICRNFDELYEHIKQYEC